MLIPNTDGVDYNTVKRPLETPRCLSRHGDCCSETDGERERERESEREREREIILLRSIVKDMREVASRMIEGHISHLSVGKLLFLEAGANHEKYLMHIACSLTQSSDTVTAL